MLVDKMAYIRDLIPSVVREKSNFKFENVRMFYSGKMLTLNKRLSDYDLTESGFVINLNLVENSSALPKVLPSDLQEKFQVVVRPATEEKGFAVELKKTDRMDTLFNLIENRTTIGVKLFHITVNGKSYNWVSHEKTPIVETAIKPLSNLLQLLRL